MTKDVREFDCIVVGAGPAGLTAGHALATLGLRTLVAGPVSDSRDSRTSALFQPSVALLTRIGAWDRAREQAAPLLAIRIIDATGSLLRAPEVTFRAAEIGLPAFGANIANRDLTHALEQTPNPRLTRIAEPVLDLEIEPLRATVKVAGGRCIAARLVVAADGRNSLVRQRAQIACRTVDYDQSAVVCSVDHTRAHDGISTEFHGPAGPLTLVPNDGRSSSIVWVERPADARRIAALDDAAFAAELTSRTAGVVGTISNPTTRRSFPLVGLTAATMAGRRVALVGEAAHVMPPIGAQGLNLSLRDAATLAELAAAAIRDDRDIGGDDLLGDYIRQRRTDTQTRQMGVGLLNHSLVSPWLATHLLRGAGLAALATVAPLRRAAMRAGLAPAANLPRLMQPISHTDSPAS